LAGGTLPGVFVLGAVYESAGVLLDQPISAVHEYILQLEQHIFRECPCDDDDAQGLAAFAGYYPRFPGFLVSEESIGDSLVAGLIYTGLVPGRDEDVVGLGVAWAELFQGGTHQEMVIEFFYEVQITPRMIFKPDLQHIGSPSGIHPDALVVGARFEVAL
jgi:hypothetical protein